MRLTREMIEQRLREGLPQEARREGPDSRGAPEAGVVDLSPLWAVQDDDEFVRAAYRLILARECDISGFVNYREMLRNHIPRRTVVHCLANSVEAKQLGRCFTSPAEYLLGPANLAGRVTGAARAAARYFAARLRALLRLVLLRPFEALQRKADYLSLELAEGFDRLSAKADKTLWTVSEKLDASVVEIDRRLSELQSVSRSLEARVNELTESQGPTQAQLRAIESRLKPAVFRGGDDLLVTEVEGFLLGVPAAEWRMAAHYAFRGVMEPGLFRLLQSLIQPGMTVVDVGANVGMYTLLAARQAGKHGGVYSFEPDPRTFSILKGNVQLNGFLEREGVVLRQAAVVDRAGTAELITYPDNSGHNTLFAQGESGVPVVVNTISLDEALADGSRVDVVKIDAEGSEPFVLRGMKRVVAENPHVRILMEFAPSHLIRAGIDPLHFLEEIQSMGFGIAGVGDVSGELYPVTNAELVTCFSAIVSLERSPAALRNSG